MGEYVRAMHEFGPVYDENSRALILGSFPSVRSREARFYYGHAQNRFWPLMARLFSCPVPQGIEEKRALMLSAHVALWDVLEECEIIGSGDGSIKKPVPVDIMPLLRKSRVDAIFCNGATAYRLYNKLLYPLCGIEAVKLPSTSPANAAWSMDRLYSQWRRITEYLSL